MLFVNINILIKPFKGILHNFIANNLQKIQGLEEKSFFYHFFCKKLYFFCKACYTS